MFFYLRSDPSSSSSSSITSSNNSFSSDNSYIPAHAKPPPTILRQLAVCDLDNFSSIGFAPQRPIQREPFRIPRPILTISRPIIHVPTNNSLWPPNVRPTRARQVSRSRSPTLISHHTERPIYQNLPISSSVSSLPSPPPISPLPPPLPQHISRIPIEYGIQSCLPSPHPPPIIQQFIPIPVSRSVKLKKVVREKPSCLFTTLSAGGFNTLVALIYLLFILALPVAKLVLGIIYIKQCPINKNIPIYIIVSGACGLAIVIFLLLSSACTYCRAMSATKKSTHVFMLCITALSRGMKGALAIFLFIWFFFGNIWILGARYRVRTDKPNDTENYCHPVLYSFAFYALIFTYVCACLTCCMKFCTSFFCCGMCDKWYKVFS